MRKIYQKAAVVNAWLGLESEDSEMAFEVFNEWDIPSVHHTNRSNRVTLIGFKS
jgi:hypothetical protein